MPVLTLTSDARSSGFQVDQNFSAMAFSFFTRCEIWRNRDEARRVRQQAWGKGMGRRAVRPRWWRASSRHAPALGQCLIHVGSNGHVDLPRSKPEPSALGTDCMPSCQPLEFKDDTPVRFVHPRAAFRTHAASVKRFEREAYSQAVVRPRLVVSFPMRTHCRFARERHQPKSGGDVLMHRRAGDGRCGISAGGCALPYLVTYVAVRKVFAMLFARNNKTGRKPLARFFLPVVSRLNRSLAFDPRSAKPVAIFAKSTPRSMIPWG